MRFIASLFYKENICYAVVVTFPITRKIILTKNQDKPINARPIAACLRILLPSLNLASSPAAVTIWKPAQSNITNAIRERIPSTQLINLFIISINES